MYTYTMGDDAEFELRIHIYHLIRPYSSRPFSSCQRFLVVVDFFFLFQVSAFIEWHGGRLVVER